MSLLPQFAPGAGQWVVPETGRLTTDAHRYLRDLWVRAGGVNALTNAELGALLDALDTRVDAAEVTIDDHETRIDVLESASSGGWTEVEIDLGAAPVYGATFTITDAAITAAKKVQVLPCAKAATGRTADDWAWDGAVFAADPGTGSATCYAHFLPGPVVGKRRIQYSVGA